MKINFFAIFIVLSSMLAILNSIEIRQLSSARTKQISPPVRAIISDTGSYDHMYTYEQKRESVTETSLSEDEYPASEFDAPTKFIKLLEWHLKSPGFIPAEHLSGMYMATSADIVGEKKDVAKQLVFLGLMDQEHFLRFAWRHMSPADKVEVKARLATSAQPIIAAAEDATGEKGFETVRELLEHKFEETDFLGSFEDGALSKRNLINLRHATELEEKGLLWPGIVLDFRDE